MSEAHALVEFPAGAPSPTEVYTTILFTDVVGSTRRAVELGDRAWRRLVERHDRLVRRAVARSGGRLIKNLGDGYLMSFDDPAAAVEGAHALVAAARAVGLEIRAGMHSGPAQVIGDDLFGLTVHIAARVCSLAGRGRVLSTAAAADPARDAGAAVVDAGLRELRDVPGKFRLFEAVPPPGTARDHAKPRPTVAPRLTLVPTQAS
jgi:class 3 adenylate cyclase